jgi:hypothetical protein
MTIWGLREQQASSNQKGSPRALASLRFIKTSNFKTLNLQTLNHQPPATPPVPHGTFGQAATSNKTYRNPKINILIPLVINPFLLLLQPIFLRLI